MKILIIFLFFFSFFFVLFSILTTLLLFCVKLATIRVAGAMEKSAQVMKSMQNLVKVSDVRQTMMEMSKEMMKVCCTVEF